jgi:oligosaccharide repeat unit polymerase
MMTALFLILIMSVLLIILTAVFEDKAQQTSLLSPLTFTVSAFIFTYLVRGVLTYSSPEEFGVFTDHYPVESYAIFLAALGISIAGVLGLMFGYAAGNQSAIVALMPNLDFRSDANAKTVSIILLLLAFAGFSVILPLVITSGATLKLFSVDSRVAVLEAWSGRGQYMFLLLQSPLLIGILMLSSIGQKSGATSKLFVLIAFVACAMCLSIIGSRQYLLALFMVAILIYHYKIKKIPLPLQLLFIGSIVLAGGLLGLLLTAVILDGPKPSLFMLAWNSFVRLTQSFDQFEMLSACLYRCNHFYFGLTPLEDIVLTYLPRSIFPFKPEVFGALRAQNDVFPHLYEYAGLTATYPIGFFGESYINFGPIGAFIFPFFFGILLRAIYENSKTQKGYIIVLTVLMANIMGTMRSFGGALLLILLSIALIKILFCLKYKYSELTHHSV